MIIVLCIIGYLLMAGISYGVVCRFIKPGIKSIEYGQISYLTESNIKKSAIRTGIFWPYYWIKFIVIMIITFIGQLIIKIRK